MQLEDFFPRSGNWNFDTCSGISGSLGPVAVGAGTIVIKNGGDRCSFGALYGGGSFSPLPASLTFSTESMPSGGKLLISPGVDANDTDFSGACVIAGKEAAMALGGQIMLAFVGGSELVLSMLAASGPLGWAVYTAGFFKLFKGVILIAGSVAGVTAGLGVYRGHLFNATYR
ncbi:MAG TPA: hypothetical protein VKU01_19570 [Bryobacteraceae bacterium]|nr:hypothetical protein [Bryobacteraceae bacterium]